MHVLKSNGQLVELDIKKIQAHAAYACEGLSDVSQSELETDSHITFYEGMPTSEIQQTLILTAADKIKDHYNWHYVAARLLLLHLFKQVTGGDLEYPSLKGYIETGIQVGGLDPDLLTNGFDFDVLEQAINPRRDRNFTYLGLSILADRYFRRNIHTQKIIELPQHFYMRVAMGLTLKGTENNPTQAAIEFYHQLSSFDFHNSTPTLFNSGTITPQLSSCYLLSMGDSIEGINGTCGEAAHYSKLSGGIGIDMTPVRSDGSLIAGTGGRSGGVIPFMKMAESTIAAFNQMGKRKGAGCLYLADFHPDIEAFLKLKNETGDPRERIPDLQTAIWHSEIFLQRKDDPDALFSLIDPHDVPELLETYGEEFNRVYLEAEAAGKYRKQVNAKELWKKMVNAAYETSSYFMGNKDMINRRSMQKDTGIVRSSNLCTEITLNTIPNEVSAVCNIGSINLANYTGDDGWLKRVVTTAVRMLDNVVSIGLVPHANGRKFQDRERAIGLGLMGETEWLVRNGIRFDSMEHLEATALLMKKISRFAIEASADLAQERGSYELFAQSEWAKGVLPYDTAPKEALELLPTSFEWYYEDDSELRAKTSKGMRNSHIMAIAPTATISHIVGTTSCTELPLELITVEENLSGNFISRSPVLKHILMEDAQTARDVDQVWVIRAAAVRQVYIDQAQSTNMYIPLGMEYADGTKVTGSVISGWRDLAMKVLKTVYYLRGVSAGAKKRELSKEQVFCSIDNPQECEACQ